MIVSVTLQWTCHKELTTTNTCLRDALEDAIATGVDERPPGERRHPQQPVAREPRPRFPAQRCGVHVESVSDAESWSSGAHDLSPRRDRQGHCVTPECSSWPW